MSVTAYQGVFHYRGLSNCDSHCGLSILPQINGKVIVILSELAANPGTSITNHCEWIATEVYDRFLLNTPVHDITWVEHYNKDSYSDKAYETERFSTVSLAWDEDKKQFCSPRWFPCGREMIGAMLESLGLLSGESKVVNIKSKRS